MACSVSVILFCSPIHSTFFERGFCSFRGHSFEAAFYLFYRFDHTPLATPNGDILIKDLTFEVKLLSLISKSWPDWLTSAEQI